LVDFGQRRSCCAFALEPLRCANETERSGIATATIEGPDQPVGKQSARFAKSLLGEQKVRGPDNVSTRGRLS